jgi:hypothetical protein
MSDIDFEAEIKKLSGEFTSLTKEAHELEKKITIDWKDLF